MCRVAEIDQIFIGQQPLDSVCYRESPYSAVKNPDGSCVSILHFTFNGPFRNGKLGNNTAFPPLTPAEYLATMHSSLPYLVAKTNSTTDHVFRKPRDDRFACFSVIAIRTPVVFYENPRTFVCGLFENLLLPQPEGDVTTFRTLLRMLVRVVFFDALVSSLFVEPHIVIH